MKNATAPHPLHSLPIITLVVNSAPSFDDDDDNKDDSDDDGEGECNTDCTGYKTSHRLIRVLHRSRENVLNGQHVCRIATNVTASCTILEITNAHERATTLSPLIRAESGRAGRRRGGAGGERRAYLKFEHRAYKTEEAGLNMVFHAVAMRTLTSNS